MPSKKINRRSKLDSAYVQKKWKNKHAPHTNNNRIKKGIYGQCGSLKDMQVKYQKKLQKKRTRICYKTIDDYIIYSSDESPTTEPDNNDVSAFLDEYQDIPIWDCPLCSYKNIEKHLFCSICNHPYSKKPKAITISKYIKQPNYRKFKNNYIKTLSKNKISSENIKDIISGKTGLPYNKIEVNPLLNQYAMSRLLRKYYRHKNEISLVYMTDEIIEDDYDIAFDGWRCQFCHHRNAKIYVFCANCYLEPLPELFITSQKTSIDPYIKQAALQDPIIDFCGLRTIVYGYCEVYSGHRLHTDIIDLIATYYQLFKVDVKIDHDILPFNQYDLSQCNDFDIYVTKRNCKMVCHSMESFGKYFEKRRIGRNIYICLLLIKSDNQWP
eukprot:956544_1